MSAVMRLLAVVLVLLHELELSGAETVIITEEYSYTATNTLFYDVFGGPVEKTYPEISTIARITVITISSSSQPGFLFSSDSIPGLITVPITSLMPVRTSPSSHSAKSTHLETATTQSKHSDSRASTTSPEKNATSSFNHNAHHGDSASTHIVIGAVVPIAVIVALVACFRYYRYVRQSNSQGQEPLRTSMGRKIDVEDGMGGPSTESGPYELSASNKESQSTAAPVVQQEPTSGRSNSPHSNYKPIVDGSSFLAAFQRGNHKDLGSGVSSPSPMSPISPSTPRTSVDRFFSVLQPLYQ